MSGADWNEEENPVIAAVRGGDVNQLLEALKTHIHLIDAPFKLDMPMHLAAAKGNARAIETLVLHGSQAIDALDPQGWTPIYHAVIGNRPSAIEMLIRLGSTSIDRPAAVATRHCTWRPGTAEPGSAETLLRLGSKAIDIKSSFHRTPLDMVPRNGNQQLLKLLMAVDDSEEKICYIGGRMLSLTEDEVAEIRYRVHFADSLVSRLLFELDRLSCTHRHEGPSKSHRTPTSM